ncbi:MAG: hypothetical protein M3198_13670 [Actinomycetota bacterium]|nr:hypothetical protein [Actinomycetota bacterium]
MRRRFQQLLLPAVIVGALLSAPAAAGGGASASEDLVVARLLGGEAVVEWYRPDGSRDRQLKLPDARPSGGMAFDSKGNLYVTDSSGGRVLRSERSGKRIATFASGLARPGSVVVAKAGKVYVGQQDEIDVVKFDPQGGRLASIDLEMVTGDETGKIDLAPDQCTIYYRSGPLIRRFDACQGRQRDDFAELGEGRENTGAVRTLPAGGVLVATQAKILGLGRSGQVVMDYDADGEDDWSQLALDAARGRKFFWAAGGDTGKVYRFNLETGGIDRELAVTNVLALAVQVPAAPPADSAPAPPPAPPPAKTPGAEAVAEPNNNVGQGAKGAHVPTTATLPFANEGNNPAAPGGGAAHQPRMSTDTPAGGLAPGPAPPRAAHQGAPAGANMADVARAQAQPPTSSHASGVSGGLSMSQLGLFSAEEPQSLPESSVPAPMVAPKAGGAGDLRAPAAEYQAEPRLQLGMATERRHQGLLAAGRDPADQAWALVLGLAAVMLFTAGLVGQRRTVRARTLFPPAVRFSPRRS